MIRSCQNMSFIFLLLTLFGIQATVGEPLVCRIRGDLTNGVKCGDKVYTRNERLVDAMRTCTAGKKGELITTEIVECIIGAYQAIVKGGLSIDGIMRDISGDFGPYAEQIYVGTKSCFEEFVDKPSDSTKMWECWSELSLRVCGIKTCNWLNNNL